MAKLNAMQIRVVSFIDQYFWENGHVPNDETIEEMTSCPGNLVKKYWHVPVFREALVSRGIDLSTLKLNEDKGLLSPQQVAVANALLNLEDRRSVREKLKSMNVTSQQYNVWKRSPRFQAYLKKRGEELFAGSDHEAYGNVIKNMQEGDLNAAKFFMEVRGIYNPKIKVDINIEIVAKQFIEIIARHVKDPAILDAIAEEVLQITTGQQEQFENALPVGNYKPEVVPSGDPLGEPESKVASRAEIIAEKLKNEEVSDFSVTVL